MVYRPNHWLTRQLTVAWLMCPSSRVDRGDEGLWMAAEAI